MRQRNHFPKPVKIKEIIMRTAPDKSEMKPKFQVPPAAGPETRTADLPPCQADPALLKQVWVNLLSNALKYAGKREAALVEIGCAMEKGRNAYFVRDNGTGFNMKSADKRLLRKAAVPRTSISGQSVAPVFPASLLSLMSNISYRGEHHIAPA
jgi:phosphoglycerate-specific signal transduction histidine kinase